MIEIGDLIKPKVRTIILLEDLNIKIIDKNDIFTVLKHEQSLIKDQPRIVILSKFGIGSCYLTDFEKIL
jgi:hypothetical protein